MNATKGVFLVFVIILMVYGLLLFFTLRNPQIPSFPDSGEAIKYD